MRKFFLPIVAALLAIPTRTVTANVLSTDRTEYWPGVETIVVSFDFEVANDVTPQRSDWIGICPAGDVNVEKDCYEIAWAFTGSGSTNKSNQIVSSGSVTFDEDYFYQGTFIARIFCCDSYEVVAVSPPFSMLASEPQSTLEPTTVPTPLPTTPPTLPPSTSEPTTVPTPLPTTPPTLPPLTSEPTTVPTPLPTTPPTLPPSTSESMPATTGTTTEKKPNILLILGDDVGQGDIPYFFKTGRVEMPNIQRLIDMGVTFTDTHSTPTCAPSRYMLLSGNYAHQSGVPRTSWNFNNEGENSFRKNQKSIAEVLRDEANYSTGMFGKWHLGGGVKRHNEDLWLRKINLLTNPNHDWTQPMIGGPKEIGFDTSFITIGGIQSQPFTFLDNDMLTINPLNQVKNWTFGNYDRPFGISRIQDRGQGEGAKDWDSSAYNMIVVNETTKFIENHLQEDSGDPFFAYVALSAVHEPQSPPRNYIDGSSVADEYATPHMDMLLEMDKVVGTLVDLIEEKGIAEDTIIIFTSDNGGLNPQNKPGQKGSTRAGHYSSGPLRGSKSFIYEGGHRVPLTFRYDNHFPPGEERNQLTGLNDMYATICDLVGVDVPELSAQDSISFADLISSGTANMPGNRTTLALFNFGNSPTLTVEELEFGVPDNIRTDGYQKSHAFRDGDYKLVHFIEQGTFELYDLSVDLAEKNNLYVDEEGEYAGRVAEMYTKLLEAGPCPPDKEGTFTLSGSGGNADVDCGWFQQDLTTPHTRCDDHLEGRLFCNSVCANAAFKNFCRLSPTLPPSPSFPLCQNTKELFKYDKEDTRINKNCNYVNTVKRQENLDLCYLREDIKSLCPVTCNSSCKCSNSGSFEYMGRTVTCDFVEIEKEERCTEYILKSHCPETCNKCGRPLPDFQG